MDNVLRRLRGINISAITWALGFVLALGLIGTNGCGGCGRQRSVEARAELAGVADVPPGPGESRGVARVLFVDEETGEDIITVVVDVDSLATAVTGIQIYEGSPGTRGRLVYSPPNLGDGLDGPPFHTSTSMPWATTGLSSGDLFDLIRNGELFIELRTESHPNGELFGILEMDHFDGWSDYYCS